MADADVVHQLAQHLKEHLGNRTLAALLTHRYTKESLGARGLLALKLRDRAIAGTLLAASEILKASSPCDELVIHIAKAHRLAYHEHEGYKEPPPSIGLELVEIDDTIQELFAADGRPPSRYSIERLRFFEDIVNLDAEEEGQWDPDADRRAGWHFECETGITGNEGTANVYTRYVLGFCRRDARQRPYY